MAMTARQRAKVSLYVQAGIFVVAVIALILATDWETISNSVFNFAKVAAETGLDAQQFEDTGLLVQALQAGTIDAALGNQSVLGYAIKDNTQFTRVEDYATGEKLGIAIKKGNTAMATQVNSTLKRLTDDGTLKKFETTWFGEAAK